MSVSTTTATGIQFQISLGRFASSSHYSNSSRCSNWSRHFASESCVTSFFSRNPSLPVSHPRRAARTSLEARASPSERADVSSFSPPPLVSHSEYEDSFFDLMFIQACRDAFGGVANWQSTRSFEEGYLGMVEVSFALMRGKNAQQQRDAVLKGFPSVPDWFRTVFPYSDWGAELNAKITPLFFSWLVGPCRVISTEVPFDRTPLGQEALRQQGNSQGANLGGQENDKKENGPSSQEIFELLPPLSLPSCVQIEKCRYLETSGCKAMCVNLCKFPTQHFFNNELGMPLYMEPNFEDLSCKMTFGMTPFADERDDPVYHETCLATCPLSGNGEGVAYGGQEDSGLQNSTPESPAKKMQNLCPKIIP